MRIPPALPMLQRAFVVGVLAAASNSPLAHAEPIALRGVEFANEAALGGLKPPPNENRRPVEFKEFREFKEFGASEALETLDTDEENVDEATTTPSEQSPGDRRAGPARRRAGQPRSAQAASMARHMSSSENLALTMDEETDWEREIREAMRSYYEQIAAYGLVDAVHELKTHLSLVSAAPADEETGSDYRAPLKVAPWELRDERFDAQGREKSPAQLENEKRIISLLIDDWIAALKPWFYGLAALYALWLVSRWGFRFSRWKSARAFRRGAKKSRSHRPARNRHVPRRH